MKVFPLYYCITFLPVTIFPHPMYCIGAEKNTAPDPAISGISVHIIGHGCLFQLISGFSAFTETIFQIWFVDSGSTSVFSQDFQPSDIVLMTVIMLHGKLTCHIPSEYHRRTVDAVMLQKLSVCDLLLHRDCPPCAASV